MWTHQISQSESQNLVEYAQKALEKSGDLAITAVKVSGGETIFATLGRPTENAFAQAVADQRDRMMQMMAALGNARAEYVVALFEDGKLDIPSFDLRKALIAADPRNADALIILRGPEGYVGRTIASTLS